MPLRMLTAVVALLIASPAAADVAPKCDCEVAGAPAPNDAPVLATLLVGAVMAAGWRLRRS